jgi:hypothetical protein
MQGLSRKEIIRFREILGKQEYDNGKDKGKSKGKVKGKGKGKGNFTL